MFATILRNRLAHVRPIVISKQNYNWSTKVLPHLYAIQSPHTILHNAIKNENIKLPLGRFSVEVCSDLDPLRFNEVCCETLESLCEYFEEILESNSHFKNSDVVYGDGVLTVTFGEPYGTYVINRQTPNKQIWLSSPTSGPKRYDFVDKDNGYWIYKHNGEPLHKLLNEEINKIVKKPVDFSKCSFSLV